MNWQALLLSALLGRRMPQTSGELRVGGIDGPVTVRRDRWGVPHISAAREPDAWFGLGFCHGQDRCFQLETLQRVVRGTVAELAGPMAVPADRLARRIGFFHAAQRQLPALGAEIRASVEAYARGVTAGATRGLPRRPHEFVLLRSRPTAWTAADVLAIAKLQSCLLLSSWDVEFARLQILSEDGPQALAALDPAYRAAHPLSAPPGSHAGPALDRLAGDLAVLDSVSKVGGGSNNWALAGERTASGRPLLANDPHLAPVLPPHWYLCHLQTPAWSAAGASFVGAPGLPAGHNGFAAWGLTAGCADNADLFLEEIGPDGRSVRQGDAFVACSLRREEIRVKGGPPIVEEVLETPRGPIIGPALDGATDAISLRAVWLDTLPMEGTLAVHRARSFEEFRRCFAAWPGPSLNMVYADASNTVGWQLAGQVPRRRRGMGGVPMPGWDEGASWDSGLVPFEKMPRAGRPAAGFVATANNRPVAAGAGPFLGEDWLDGYRLARIVEALGRRDDWDVASTLALQLDQRSLPWREVRDVVLAAPAANADTRLALELLGRWDGIVEARSPAAAVFELFCAEMAQRLARAKAPRSYDWALGRGFPPLVALSGLAFRRVGHLMRLLGEQPDGWLDRGWPEEIADALAAAVRRLRDAGGRQAGGDPARWAWGALRPITLEHPIGARPLLRPIFNRGPFPWGGDSNTVGQASVNLLKPLANPSSTASLRMVVDVGAWEQSRFILPGGQSGNPLSPHYDDQLPLWRRGDGIPIPWSEDAVRRATRATLRLVPEDPRAGTAA